MNESKPHRHRDGDGQCNHPPGAHLDDEGKSNPEATMGLAVVRMYSPAPVISSYIPRMKPSPHHTWQRKAGSNPFALAPKKLLSGKSCPRARQPGSWLPPRHINIWPQKLPFAATMVRHLTGEEKSRNFQWHQHKEHCQRDRDPGIRHRPARQSDQQANNPKQGQEQNHQP